VNERVLAWDGCLNVRDLGGLPTEDGGRTRLGVVIRADTIRQLSVRGWAALVDYGVRTIVDLRFRSELEADPPRDLPVDVVHVSVLPDRDSPHWREIETISAAAPDDAGATSAVYLEFLRRFQRDFARAIEAVAQAPHGGVLVHCLGGKDRTGLVAALLLRVAGVTAAAIADDYALSAANLEPRDGPWISAADDERERARRSRIAASPRKAMLDVLAELDRRHGGAVGYLRDAGVSRSALEAIRARLTR